MRIPIGSLVTQPILDPEWVVSGMIPRGSFVILAGEHGTGKSALLYHLSLCVAAGLDFLGHPTVRTEILYFDVENSKPDMTRYWQHAWRGLGCPDPGIWDRHLRFEWFSLGPDWATKMRVLAREAPTPGLIVIDTATPALSIQDENDNAEASRKISELQDIQHSTDNDTTMLVLKHEKTRDDKTHRRTVRGAKAWLGAVDIVMYLSFKRGGSHGLRRTILEADKPRAFGLKAPIEIVPSWSQSNEPKGLILNAQCALVPDEEGK